MRKGFFDGKIKFEDVTITDFKKVSFEEMSKRIAELMKKFR